MVGLHNKTFKTKNYLDPITLFYLQLITSWYVVLLYNNLIELSYKVCQKFSHVTMRYNNEVSLLENFYKSNFIKCT